MTKIHELVQAWAAAWGAKSVDDFLSLFTDDCVYEDVPTGRVNRGKEQLAAFARQVMTGFPDFQFEVTSCVATTDSGTSWRGKRTLRINAALSSSDRDADVSDDVRLNVAVPE